jgi:hypothetical protein
VLSRKAFFSFVTVTDPARHHVAAYRVADPADRSMVEWQDLAEQSFQWGRRPDMPFVARSSSDGTTLDAEALEPYFSSPCESIIPNNWDFFVREAGK